MIKNDENNGELYGIVYLTILTIFGFSLIFPIISFAADDTVTIKFEDANLYNAIVSEIGDKIKSKDDKSNKVTIKQTDLEDITDLKLNNEDITDISGIEKFTNLEYLHLNENQI